LEELKGTLTAEVAHETFTSPESLGEAVASALGRWLAENPQAETLSPVSASPVSIPPNPYFAHPYPLQENFTGRRRERSMLTEWVGEDVRYPMLSLVGMGGMGKSALTWFWLHEDLPEEGLEFAGTLRWSFYEQDAGFESFVNRALLYASSGRADPQAVSSTYERIEWLFSLLRDNPFLLVLDGAERLLRAYARLDAPYQGDEVREEKGDAHLLCADPRAGQFLQALSSYGMRTRTLMTTRLHPRELTGLAGCRREDLVRLDPDDAVEFLRRQGVKGPRTEIVQACEQYGFHPLCLRLLSGVIREDPERPGDIGVAAGWRPDASLKRKEHHILELSYDTMQEDRRKLLSRMAAMRSPLDYDQAKVLSEYHDEADLKSALKELVGRGLLLWDRDKARYDLHPIVRHYAYDRLGDKTAAHQVLKDYFIEVPAPKKPETLEDLAPLIELFHHTVSTGGYYWARKLLRNRLTAPLYYQLGAYDLYLSLVEALFPDGEDNPPRLERESDQAWTLNELANVCGSVGQNRRAAGLMERSNAIDEGLGSKPNVAIGLTNLAGAQMHLGELISAEENLRRSIDICVETKERFSEGIGHQELGRLLARRGEYGESRIELAAALRVFAEEDQVQSQCVVWSYLARRALWMGDAPSALDALAKAREFWELTARRRFPVERDFVRILWLSGAARVRLNEPASADKDLAEALSRCRKIRLVEFEPDILLEMAKLRWLAESKQSREEATKLAHEALEIADRCEYRLVRADIHNFLARMAMDRGDRRVARREAEVAKERALCDGPPYCYRKALDEADAMLAEV